MTGFEIRPLSGIGEVEPGDDLAALLADAIARAGRPLGDGDIVVVASKVVSKAEGRIRRGLSRDAAVDEETVRVVAERGRTRIAQTRHGFVMAAAGVDESNVEPGSVVLLPLDPDASARALRAELTRRTGARVGVLITDTFGRTWRIGQTDLAIGAAGVLVLDEYAGQTDPYGNSLVVTAPALADELASAADLARPKLSGVPVAIVSGLDRLVTVGDGPGVRVQVRTADEDLFRLGTREAIRSAAVLPRFANRVGGRPSAAPSPEQATARVPEDAEPDADRIERVIAEVLASGEFMGDEPADGTRRRDHGQPAEDDGWDLTGWRDEAARSRPLAVLGLPPEVPYVLAATARPGKAEAAAAAETTAAAGIVASLLQLGALLDRIALALTADGFGVRRAAGVELTEVADAVDPDQGTLVALLAIGAPVGGEGGPGQSAR